MNTPVVLFLMVSVLALMSSSAAADGARADPRAPNGGGHSRVLAGAMLGVAILILGVGVYQLGHQAGRDQALRDNRAELRSAKV
ncbi:hypothetical protein [uncultured Brevundimonas sp.]|uniref:hypothetical protein n=1 Tax=uncultured Brevundimonas sp. TaxID=213418 RepID=UPI0026015F88|nr:hypothetical protein [uncultured Brevundimonas sp.]